MQSTGYPVITTTSTRDDCSGGKVIAGRIDRVRVWFYPAAYITALITALLLF
ncbi:MAG TPA: hypothetical protein PLG75_06195 [Methanoculleus sp.]|nr:hypothetical protein [Methanoculleus sp.]